MAPPPPSDLPRRVRLSPAIAAALLVLAVAAAWAGSLAAPFEFDDHASILDNATIRQLWPADWLRPPATAGETVSGRPVLNLSFALNHAAGGLDVRGYRAANVLLHGLAALLLFGVARRTLIAADRRGAAAVEPAAADIAAVHPPRRRASGAPARLDDASDRRATASAFIIALLWAVHPLQTAAVTYVVQRAEALAALFGLLALYGFVRGVEASTPSPRRAERRGEHAEDGESHRRAAARGWFALAIAACLLGVGTKEIIAAAPVIILLYDRTFAAGSFRAAWRARGWVHAILFATWLPLLALVIANHGRGGSAGLDAAAPVGRYALTQAEAIVRYVRLAVWPAGQVFDYGVPLARGFGDVWLPALLLAAGLGATVRALVRNRPAGWLGAVFFLALAPSSSVVPIATQTIAEHRMYLPLAALVALACIGARGMLRRLRAPGWAGAAAALVVAAALAGATVARNAVYASELSLWCDTVAKRPDNARAHHNLGRALEAAGRTDEAMLEFERTIALQPNHAYAHFGLGTALMKRDRLPEAAEQFRAALAADPRYVSARINLGEVLARLGQTEAALAEYRAALALDPAAVDAKLDLAALLIDAGDAEEAVARLREVVAAAPALVLGRYHLGRALEKTGDVTAAEAAYREAVRLDPAFVPGQVALGNRLAQRGEAAEAERCYREAIRLDPRAVAAHFGRGNLLAKQQQFEPAMAEYRAVLSIQPDHLQARNNLGNCQLVTGRWAEAVATYEDVLRRDPGDTAVQRNLALARELARSGHP